MCIVIDANAWGPIFNPNNEDHDNFKPIYKWLYHGKGKIVYGGTKYGSELKRSERYLRLFNSFKDINKVIILKKEKVDQEEIRLKGITNEYFNDEHLIAIINISGCKLLCSNNTQDFKEILSSKYYLRDRRPPKIYTKNSASNAKTLLGDNNIADICKPCRKTTRNEMSSLEMM